MPAEVLLSAGATDGDAVFLLGNIEALKMVLRMALAGLEAIEQRQRPGGDSVG